MVADYLTCGLAQHVVTIKFTKTWRFREVKEADTWVSTS